MKRILVVDDNPDILDVFKIILKGKGYEVYALLQGQRTIEIVNQFSPDLILLDVYLSDCNGIDICNSIKSTPALKKIPIVMVSAHSNLQTILKDCPADTFIEKPLDIDDLLRVIESQLNKRK